MIEIKPLFDFKQMNKEKITAFGFVGKNGAYEISKLILDNQFYLTVTIDQAGQPDYLVKDAATNEEYTLVKSSSAQGSFVGRIRTACVDFLTEIAESCYEVAVFKSAQTKRMLQSIANDFQVDAEYPWEKHPGNAIFRHHDNQKWFAIIMVIDGKKIDPSLDKEIEIIDLKATAEDVATMTANDNYYPGYHMNKKYWYTIILDDSITDKELINRIHDSFQLTQ